MTVYDILSFRLPVMGVTFCTNCGARLPTSSTRCASCGAVVPADDVAVRTEAVPVATDDGEPEGERRPLPRGQAATLEVIRGRNAGARFVVGVRTTLGRSPDSDVFLDDVSVSRDHATIVAEPPGRYVVTDRGSLNGTYVNDERLDEAVLRHGDVLQIGMFKLAFATGSAE